MRIRAHLYIKPAAMIDRNALSASVYQASSNDRPQYFTRNSSRCRGHHDTSLVSCTHRRRRSQRRSYFSVTLKANAPLVPRSRVPPVEPLSFSIKQNSHPRFLGRVCDARRRRRLRELSLSPVLPAPHNCRPLQLRTQRERSARNATEGKQSSLCCFFFFLRTPYKSSSYLLF